MQPSTQTILTRLKQARKALDVSQSELSKLSGIKQSQISKLESGKSIDPSLETVIKLTEALGVPLSDISEDAVNWPLVLTELTRKAAKAKRKEDFREAVTKIEHKLNASHTLSKFDILQIDSHILEKLPVILHTREAKEISIIKAPESDVELGKLLSLFSKKSIAGRIVLTPDHSLIAYTQGWTDDQELKQAVEPLLIPLPGVLRAVDGLRELKKFDIDGLDFSLSNSQILPLGEKASFDQQGFAFQTKQARSINLANLPHVLVGDFLAKTLGQYDYVVTIDFYPWDSKTWIRKSQRKIDALEKKLLEAEEKGLMQGQKEASKLRDLLAMVHALESEITAIFNANITISLQGDSADKIEELQADLEKQDVVSMSVHGHVAYQAAQLLEPQNSIGGQQLHIQAITNLATKSSSSVKVL